MGFIIHTFRLDKDGNYLDHFEYVKKIGQKIYLILAGYGYAQVEAEIMNILENGIVYQVEGEDYFISANGESKNIPGGGNMYRAELYTVDYFFKHELNKSEMCNIIEDVLDNIFDPEKYFPYYIDYFKKSNSGWWKYVHMLEVYRKGKYGQKASIDGYIDLLLSDLDKIDKEKLLEKYHDRLVREIETIEKNNVGKERRNYFTSYSSDLSDYHNKYLEFLKNNLYRIDEESVNKLSRYVFDEAKNELFSYTVAFSAKEIIDLYLDNKINSGLIDEETILALAGIYLSIMDDKVDYLIKAETYTIWDGDTMESDETTDYYFSRELARNYVRKAKEKGNEFALRVIKASE